MSLDGDSYLSYPIEKVEVDIVGRQKVLDRLTSDDIVATVDDSSVEGSGVTELPIIVSSKDSGVYFRVEQQLPETISVLASDKSE